MRSSTRVLAAAALAAIAIRPALGEEPATNIVDHMQADSVISVAAPDKLLDRLQRVDGDEQPQDLQESKASNTPGRAGGYRVQVYSDNNQRTAKSEAQARARAIQARFPQHRTYVVYNAPFWRLRVGDFRNQDEARQFLVELKGAFPVYSREMRVVRDRVTINK